MLHSKPWASLSQELESERPPDPPGRPCDASAGAFEWACCKRHATRYRDVDPEELAALPDTCAFVGWRLVAAWLGLWFGGAAVLLVIASTIYQIGKLVGWLLAMLWLALA